MQHANLRVASKSTWNVVRAIYFMLTRGMSKGKLMKRGKIAGKALHGIIFQHQSDCGRLSVSARDHYEYRGKNNPTFSFSKLRHSHLLACLHAPSTYDDTVAARKALEMFDRDTGFFYSPTIRNVLYGEAASPVLSRTMEDSQISVMRSEMHVDEAADEFISNFYHQLRSQNIMVPC